MTVAQLGSELPGLCRDSARPQTSIKDHVCVSQSLRLESFHGSMETFTMGVGCFGNRARRATYFTALVPDRSWELLLEFTLELVHAPLHWIQLRPLPRLSPHALQFGGFTYYLNR